MDIQVDEVMEIVFEAEVEVFVEEIEVLEKEGMGMLVEKYEVLEVEEGVGGQDGIECREAGESSGDSLVGALVDVIDSVISKDVISEVGDKVKDVDRGE